MPFSTNQGEPQMTGLFQKLAGQTLTYGMSSIIGRLLNYLLVPLYTRVFLPQEYGVVTELYAWAGFLTIVYSYGMETAFFRFSTGKESEQTVFKTGQTSLLVTSFLFSLLLLLFSENLAAILSYPQAGLHVCLFAGIFFFDTATILPFARLRLKERAARFAILRLLNISANIGLNLFFLVFLPWLATNQPGAMADALQTFFPVSFGVGYVFLSNLAASLLTFFLFLPTMMKAGWGFNPAVWKQMTGYGFPLLIVGLAGAVNEMLDRTLLRWLLPGTTEQNLAQIGIYGACYKLSILMTLFIQAYRYAAEPFFFRQAAAADSRESYARLMLYFTLAGAFIFVAVVALLDLFKHFIGPAFHEGLMVVPPLLLANWFLGIYYNLSVWYKLSDKTGYGAIVSIAGAILTVVLNLALIPAFGYVGSAWATLACYASMTIISWAWGRKVFPVPYPVFKIGGLILIASALSFGHFYLLAPLISGNYFAGIISGAGLLSLLGVIGWFLVRGEIKSNL